MKKFLRCLAVLLPVVLVLGSLWIGLWLLAPPNKKEAEMLLKTDEKLLKTVTTYLENSGYESMSFNKTFADSQVEDEEVAKTINKLFNRGYDAIGLQGNTIYFLRWTRLKDFGAGLAYSINGTDEPQMEYLVKIEELSEEQWYYYEEN